MLFACAELYDSQVARNGGLVLGVKDVILLSSIQNSCGSLVSLFELARGVAVTRRVRGEEIELASRHH